MIHLQLFSRLDGDVLLAGPGTISTVTNMASAGTLAMDPQGNIYVAERDRNVIKKVDAVTKAVTVIAGTGLAGFSGDGGPALAARLFVPYGVAVDASMNVFFSDAANNRIRVINASTGIINTYAGSGAGGSGGDGGPAKSANLSSPAGIRFDVNGNLHIADYYNHRIRKVNAATGIITTVAGSGVFGSGGDGGPATSASMKYPIDVAFDSKQNMYISDRMNNCVRRVDAMTGIITRFAGGGSITLGESSIPALSASLIYTWQLAIDSQDNVFIALDLLDRVTRVDSVTGLIARVAGGNYENCGDGVPATAACLDDPSGVAVHAQSGSAGSIDLYIADLNSIRKVEDIPLIGKWSRVHVVMAYNGQMMVQYDYVSTRIIYNDKFSSPLLHTCIPLLFLFLFASPCMIPLTHIVCYNNGLHCLWTATLHVSSGKCIR